MSAPATAAGPSRSPWLFGPGIDLLFGYGLLYVLSVPPLLVWTMGAGDQAWLAPALALFLSIPHYGATILRVYERPDDRRRYAVFAVGATAVLAALFVASLWVGLVGSLLLTAYVSWSPWHFSGQNYGLFLMALRRSGVDPSDLKRPLYASFVASAAVAILGMHVASGADASFSIQAYDASGTFRVLPLGVPAGVAGALALGAGVFWLACVVQVARRVVGRVRGMEIAPLVVLMAMQGLWYLPSVGRLTGFFGPSEAGFAFTAIWIASAHAVQYLWVTFYYARRQGRQQRLASFYGKAWLAGAFLLAPTLLLAPGLLGGGIPNALGIAVLTIAVLNLHHFILDGAIWKMRDGRVARVLLRPESPGEGPEPVRPRARLRPVAALVWTLALVTLAGQGYATFLFFRVSQEDLPLPALQRSAAELAWLGQDTPGLWARVGRELESEGRRGDAAAAYARAIRIGDAPKPWVASRLAWLLLEADRSGPRALARAEQLAHYLVQRLGDTRPEGHQTLAEVRSRQGRWDEAIAAADAALRIARADGDGERVRHIEAQLRRYRRQQISRSGDAAHVPAEAAAKGSAGGG